MMDTLFDIMVISPHADDAEFGAAGSVALWARSGKKVIYVICTNGDPDPLAHLTNANWLPCARIQFILLGVFVVLSLARWPALVICQLAFRSAYGKRIKSCR